MSIKTNYNFHGIEVQDAILKIDRLWGSSKEGWNSLVSVYRVKLVPTPAMVDPATTPADPTATTTPADPAATTTATPAATETTVLEKLTEFNFSVPYVASLLPYEALYTKLMEVYGGVAVVTNEVLATPTTVVPARITMRQARLQLLAEGLLDSVNAMLVADPALKIEWEYASYIERNSAIIETLASALNLTVDDVDQMFIKAKNL